MLRATRPRGDVFPTPKETTPANPTSLEALLALALCALVVLATMALLRRSSAFTRVLDELHKGTLAARTERPRQTHAQSGTGPRPDLVILVALDGLRADRLELYGHGRETAPRLRALAEEGVVFRTVAAQSSQPLTSHKSLLTGKYPATLMLEETGADLLELSHVRAPREFLLETFTGVKGLLAAGYRARAFRTAAFTGGEWVGRETGFEHGFDVFDDAGGGQEAVQERALAWLETNGMNPALLFLQAADLRFPYASREPFENAFCREHPAHAPLVADGRADPTLAPADLAALADHYDGAVRSVDERLGRFLDGLRARGLYERALILVTSGHGESLGERGHVGHGGLHVEELLVPLVLKFPASWKQRPTSVSEPIELVDVLPSLFALCGVSAVGELDGRSFLPTLFRGVHGRDFLVAHSTLDEAPGMRSSPSGRTLLRPGRWQVIQDLQRSQARFFALAEDWRGLSSLPIEADELSPLLEILVARGRSGPRSVLRSARPAAFSTELERELDQLGYGSARE